MGTEWGGKTDRTLAEDIDRLNLAVRACGRALWAEAVPPLEWLCDRLADLIDWFEEGGRVDRCLNCGTWALVIFTFLYLGWQIGRVAL